MKIHGTWRTWLTGGLALLAGGLVIAQFSVPSKWERSEAAGSLAGLDESAARSFTDGGEFSAKKAPEPSDWLAQHREGGQTYSQYLRSKPNKPDGKRRVIYILPLGEFEKGNAPSLATLRDYTAAYYYPMKVSVMPFIPNEKVVAKSRINAQTANKQWKSEDILRWLQGKLPGDAYAMIAVTMTDLYPTESWNYVFGQASLRHRVGVFSFARYHPSFWKETPDGGTEKLMLTRAAKVLTHETGHMFGIAHCVHYECNMNGSNHLREADAAPIHLCPVCLRKMHHAVGFDPVMRYKKLLAFYVEHGLDAEADWVKERLKRIGGK